jgi:hypothetical protein
MTAPKFPKPWKIEHVGPEDWVVTDANGTKLFHIQSDDNPDGDGDPGDNDGATILGYDEDSDFLLDELTETLGRLS